MNNSEPLRTGSALRLAADGTAADGARSAGVSTLLRAYSMSHLPSPSRPTRSSVVSHGGGPVQRHISTSKLPHIDDVEDVEDIENDIKMSSYVSSSHARRWGYGQIGTRPVGYMSVSDEFFHN